MCTHERAKVWFEPYCGRSTLIKDAGLGQGPNVVLSLAAKAKLDPGEHIYCNNLFTSSALLSAMSNQGIGVTGTVRQNCLHKAYPLNPWHPSSLAVVAWRPKHRFSALNIAQSTQRQNCGIKMMFLVKNKVCGDPKCRPETARLSSPKHFEKVCPRF